MAHFENAFRIAAETNHQPPPWINNNHPPPANFPDITQRAIDIFMMSQRPNGEMGGIGWWQTANGYTAIALHDLWSSNSHNYSRIADAVRKCESHCRDLINEFNDDTLWWGMLCVHLYNLGGEDWFLEKAKGIWRHVRGGWVCGKGDRQFKGEDMEGACFWTSRPGEGQINSISSGLFAELSARLAIVERKSGGGGGGFVNQGGHGLTEKHPHLSKLMHFAGVEGSGAKPTSCDDYVEAARCSLGWVIRCMYRPRDGVVLDSILLKKGEKREWTFSYLTGVAIAACTALFEATHRREYLDLAIHMAHKAMRNPGWAHQEEGVLCEDGIYGKGNHDPAKNDDAITFKQVLMRQLCDLYDVIGRMRVEDQKVLWERQLIKTFVNSTFHSLQTRDTNGNGQYGPWWRGPMEMPTSHSQLAVLDVMAGVRLVNRS